ncbi:hypothetical protein EX30DRAFT_390853, partial [Ascodesmis nigricans]
AASTAAAVIPTAAAVIPTAPALGRGGWGGSPHRSRMEAYGWCRDTCGRECGSVMYIVYCSANHPSTPRTMPESPEPESRARVHEPARRGSEVLSSRARARRETRDCALLVHLNQSCRYSVFGIHPSRIITVAVLTVSISGNITVLEKATDRHQTTQLCFW